MLGVWAEAEERKTRFFRLSAFAHSPQLNKAHSFIVKMIFQVFFPEIEIIIKINVTFPIQIK